MSATARRHRRSVAHWRSQERLRTARESPIVSLGHQGANDEVFIRGPVLFVLPRVKPGMPAELVEAITRRRQASLEGLCVCGARQHVKVSRAGHLGSSEIAHENGCSASDTAIAEIAERTGWEVGA